MKTTLGGVLAVVCLTACGDNSKQSGDGTNDDDGDGVCEPDGTTDLICGDGTVLDTLTLECIPDPSVCGNGTVLINGTCQDPTADLDIDLIEGPEPNGFELDATSAGTIPIKVPGESTVIRGCVAPIDNNSPDLDVYEFDVAGPTLLHITADGVEGLAAGFLLFGEQALGNWFRMGINIATDTSRREVYLPIAGRYQFVMTDTRTLLPLTQNGEGFPAAGNPDGTSCYFVTIAQRAIPSPATLDLANGTTGEIGEELKFFTANFPTGLVNLRAVIDPEDIDGDGFPDLDTLGNLIDSRAASSLVLVNNDAVRKIRDANADGPAIEMLFGGVKAGDAAVIVLDYVWNFAIGPADFAIDATGLTSSLALSTSGGTVSTTTNGKFFRQGNEIFFENINLFHFDVTTAGQVDAMNISFGTPVQGSIIDQDGFTASPFTNLVGLPHTFELYQGLIRSIAPGRYYFVVFAPLDDVGTTLDVTSTITTIDPTALTLDTASTPVAFNAVHSNPFRYDLGTEPWQTLEGTLAGGSDAISVEIFDPAVTIPQTPGFAFGRLDRLVTTFDGAPPSSRAGDGTPLFVDLFDDGDQVHRILRNSFGQLPPNASDFLIKVNPTVASPAGTFSLEFATRAYEDFTDPNIAAGASKSDNETMAGGVEQRYFFQTTPGHTTTITVQLTNQPNLDPVIELLDSDENVIRTADTGELNQGESLVLSQNLSGFTAFRVRGASGTSAGDYTVQVSVAAADYTATQAPAGFVDACLGGVLIELSQDLSGNPADDEGLSGPIAAPAGFQLHGAALANFKISSNGFLSSNVSLLDANFSNFEIAAGGDISIAPHWDDLTDVIVCTQTIGDRLVVQWEGIDFDNGAPVQFQAILDPDGKIDFAYGPFHFADGATASYGTAGATSALSLGVDVPLVVPSSGIQLTPN